jgi:hypothetical protein
MARGTVVGRDSDGFPTLRSIPSVDIETWLQKIDINSYNVGITAPSQYSKYNPIIWIQSLVSKPDHLMQITGNMTAQGAAFTWWARSHREISPRITLLFKDWSSDSEQRALAAIYSIVAFHAEQPRLPRKYRLADEWLRRMHAKLLRRNHKNTHVLQSKIVDILDCCEKRFKSLAGLDVCESRERVRKEFELLTEHLEESEIVRIWRDVIVSKVLIQ